MSTRDSIRRDTCCYHRSYRSTARTLVALTWSHSRRTADRYDYQRQDLDELALPAASFDLAVSSLALHYVVDLAKLMQTVTTGLRPLGSLVFSVEHPILSAPTRQSFVAIEGGQRVWPLDGYLVEGERTTNWFADGVRKQHRTVATYVDTIVGAGLRIDRLVEWGPSPAQVAEQPELAEDLDRPWFLLIAASKHH